MRRKITTMAARPPIDPLFHSSSSKRGPSTQNVDSASQAAGRVRSGRFSVGGVSKFSSESAQQTRKNRGNRKTREPENKHRYQNLLIKIYFQKVESECFLSLSLESWYCCWRRRESWTWPCCRRLWLFLSLRAMFFSFELCHSLSNTFFFFLNYFVFSLFFFLVLENLRLVKWGPLRDGVREVDRVGHSWSATRRIYL